VAHFPDGALSGYAGTDFESFASFDWDRLHEAIDEVLGHARRLKLWVVLGSAHRLSGPHKPSQQPLRHQRRGPGRRALRQEVLLWQPGRAHGDLAHYSPGDHPSVWAIDVVPLAGTGAIPSSGQRPPV
jgi:hypothetical protein